MVIICTTSLPIQCSTFCAKYVHQYLSIRTTKGFFPPQTWLIGVCNVNGVCSLRGTNGILKYNLILVFNINKIQRDATVCRCLFIAKSLYMFRVSIAPIIRCTWNCNCSFWYRSYHVSGQQPSASVASVWPIRHASGKLLLWNYELYQKLQLQFYVLLMMGVIDTRNM